MAEDFLFIFVADSVDRVLFKQSKDKIDRFFRVFVLPREGWAFGDNSLEHLLRVFVEEGALVVQHLVAFNHILKKIKKK